MQDTLKMTTRQIANKHMHRAFRCYEKSAELRAQSNNTSDRVNRNVWNADANMYYLEAGNYAREAARLFSRC